MIPVLLMAAAAGWLIGGLLTEDDLTGGLLGEDDRSDEFPLDITFRDDDDGRHILLTPQFEVQDGTRYRVYMAVKPRNLKIHPLFADNEDGSFVMTAAAIGTAGEGFCFVPWGALDAQGGATIELAVSTFENDQFLGTTGIEKVYWPSRGGYSTPRHWRPLIELARAVAEPFGEKSLDSANARVREWLDIEPRDDAAFRIVWRSPRSEDVEATVHELFRRFPTMDFSEAFSELSSLIPQGQDTANPIMMHIAHAMGLEEEDWLCGAPAQLEGTPHNMLSAACGTLRISRSPTLDETRKAYRALIKDYHPDRVAGLPPEFKALAMAKSQELNAAYSTVLNHLRHTDQPPDQRAIRAFKLSA